MIRVLAALCVLTGTARAQHPGPENSPESCSDGVDNDGNGYVDCQDPKCKGVGQCRALEVVSTGEDKLTPRAQIIAGVIMLLAGPAIAAGSSAVYLDAIHQPKVTKNAVEYAVAAVMDAAGVAILVGGGVLIKRGVRRHQEDVEMGLALGPNKLELRVRF
jgi:hypothetical protein